MIDQPAKRPKTRAGSSKKTELLRKRKADEDISGDQPVKVGKTGRQDVTVAVEETAGVSKHFQV